MSKNTSLFVVFISYIFAVLSGWYYLQFYSTEKILVDVLIADIIATVVIYLASVIFKNSSIYDPYWSVIPPFILVYFISHLDIDLFSMKSILLVVNVFLWSIRLTSNWIKGWKGLGQEDWRYVDMREYSGKYFELSNFLGIHLFPTLIVFACCVPMYYTLLYIDFISVFVILGFLVSLVGVIYEYISDYQLYQFKKENPGSKGIIENGLWKYSRHPNYWGEILFWWGLYLYAIGTFHYVLILAPVSMTIMFLYVSIPWIEHKILRNRPQYKSYQERVSILVPEFGYLKKKFF
tara:strand:+ start:2876 stop:3751 length:876 start_codon:yes stop_codon:yes gene_type:complete